MHSAYQLLGAYIKLVYNNSLLSAYNLNMQHVTVSLSSG